MKLKTVLLTALCLALLYVWVATTAYRFEHPELTETELFLRIPEALGFGNGKN